MKFLILFTFFSISLSGFSQVDNVSAVYDVLFNQRFDQQQEDFRRFKAYLTVFNSSASDFFMLPGQKRQDTENSIEIGQDTLWRVRMDLEEQELFFDDVFNEKLTPKWFADSLFPMRWTIGKESILIDSLVCQSATTVFRGRSYLAWFCPSISLPFGPWKLGGLPGLIVRVEDAERNLVMSLFSLSRGAGIVQSAKPVSESYGEYLRSGNEIRKKMRLSVSTTDCVDCESNVKFHSWEKVFQ